MNLSNDEGKLNFIVSTQYSIRSPQQGASIVLNKLAYEIAIRGHNVYVFNDPYFMGIPFSTISYKIIGSIKMFVLKQ